ncbi:hypothetical protein AB1L30_06360, partial [Bremerella sp. JC817]|uniref:hypothetical protein n=1 Tax=Bremerella sp. JC817 TaxID=3231756 RepID=UPI0034590E6E
MLRVTSKPAANEIRNAGTWLTSQGYGDLACHGNQVIQTPNLDRLASQSSQLSNYHVAPTEGSKSPVVIQVDENGRITLASDDPAALDLLEDLLIDLLAIDGQQFLETSILELDASADAAIV